MSEIRSLSASQQKALELLATGSTAAAAAVAARVHRNTLSNWLCLPAFRHALDHAAYERAVFYREQAECIIGAAYQAITEILNDPKAPAGVRLKAALAIIEKAAAPLPDLPAIPLARTSGSTPESQNLHNSAQPDLPPDSLPASPLAPPAPKIGRNHPCPCGSGRKFKQCCLSNLRSTASCIEMQHSASVSSAA